MVDPRSSIGLVCKSKTYLAFEGFFRDFRKLAKLNLGEKVINNQFQRQLNNHGKFSFVFVVRSSFGFLFLSVTHPPIHAVVRS